MDVKTAKRACDWNNSLDFSRLNRVLANLVLSGEVDLVFRGVTNTMTQLEVRDRAFCGVVYRMHAVELFRCLDKRYRRFHAHEIAVGPEGMVVL